MKRLARPLLAAFLASAAPMALLAQTELRLVVPVSGSGDALVSLAEAYNAAQSDTRIAIQRFPAGDGYGQGLITQLQSGAGPDVFFVNGGYGALESLMPMVEAGQIAPLTARDWAGMVPEGARDAYYAGDALYGLPLSLGSVGTVFNPELLTQLGLDFPADQDQMFAACATAKDAGLSFSSIPGQIPFYLVETIAVSEVYAETPDWNAQRRAGTVSFAETPGWTRTFETFKRMADEGCFQLGYQSAGIADLFAAMAGYQTVSGVGPVTLAGAVMHMNPDIQLSVGPWPAGDRTVGIGSFNDGVAVNAASTHAEAAMAFVDWLAEPEQLRAYAAVAGGTATVDVIEGNFTPLVAPLAPYYAQGILPLPHSGWTSPAVRDALNRGAIAYLTDQMSIAEVLASMDAAWSE